MKVQRAEIPATLAGHDAARRFFESCFLDSGATPRRLWVAHLDERARCIELDRHSGDMGAGDVPLDEILADAARLGSAGVILAHQDRAGDGPRPEERAATRALVAAGEAIEMTLVDHLVFAPSGECRSYRRMGLL